MQCAVGAILLGAVFGTGHRVKGNGYRDWGNGHTVLPTLATTCDEGCLTVLSVLMTVPCVCIVQLCTASQTLQQVSRVWPNSIVFMCAVHVCRTSCQCPPWC